MGDIPSRLVSSLYHEYLHLSHENPLTERLPGVMNIYLNFYPVNINTGTIDVSLVQIRSAVSF